MKVAVVRESCAFESRVAISPEVVKKMIDIGLSVFIERGAGLKASFFDRDYEKAGAKLTTNFKNTVYKANLLLKVQAPSLDEIKNIPEGIILLGMLGGLSNIKQVNAYIDAGIDSLSIDLIPRISRAQSMDVLSSQSNLAGYRAVIEGAYIFSRAFPMMITMAGTISPARVLILGVGVAGLQAIATAKRLGAIVFAFDIRPIVREQVESLGAIFIEIDFLRKLKTIDIVIATALIPGKSAPILVTKSMIKDMKTGSVIIDLAAPNGGNCQESKPGELIRTENGVSILAPLNIISNIACDASKLYARNLWNFIQLILDKEKCQIKLENKDQIVQSTLLTYKKYIVKKIV